MDWHWAIERNREALKCVLAGLVAMAGLGPWAEGIGPSGTGTFLSMADRPTLPRRLHRAVLRLLRPAESATRRLIIIAARDLGPEPKASDEAPEPKARNNDTAPQARPAETAPPPRKPAPKSAVPLLRSLGIAVVVPAGVAVPVAPGPVPRPLALPLADPLRALSPRRRTVPPHAAPRILSFDGAVPHRLPPRPSPHDPLDATRLCRRLAALADALADLPGQARRFVRWQARRARERARDRARAEAQASPRIRWCRLSPLRVGRPPGLRAKARASDHETQEILRDTHWFAVRALAPPDTS